MLDLDLVLVEAAKSLKINEIIKLNIKLNKLNNNLCSDCLTNGLGNPDLGISNNITALNWILV